MGMMIDCARMKTSDVAERILHFNQGRHPELLRMKLERLRQDAFVFLRGTCHLFYEEWPADSVLNEAPRVWLCGDLHLENFGSYKADNRLVADELIAFADRPQWRQDLLRVAQDFHDRVVADYQAYCAAYKRVIARTIS